jgi:PIN domain nuclease of toxin-antitoxin system
LAAITLLLHTHPLLWWLFDDPKLASDARLAIANPQNTVIVSPASAWEITTKHRLGRLLEAGDCWFAFGQLAIAVAHFSTL